MTITEQTRSSGPSMEAWNGAAGLGGYLTHEDDTTTVWIVTPEALAARETDPRAGR